MVVAAFYFKPLHAFEFGLSPLVRDKGFSPRTNDRRGLRRSVAPNRMELGEIRASMLFADVW